MLSIGSMFTVRKCASQNLPNRLAKFAGTRGRLKKLQTIGGTLYYVLTFGSAEGEFKPCELEPVNALPSK